MTMVKSRVGGSWIDGKGFDSSAFTSRNSSCNLKYENKVVKKKGLVEKEILIFSQNFTSFMAYLVLSDNDAVILITKRRATKRRSPNPTP